MNAYQNPFIVKGYRSAEFFCDREQELQELYRNVKNGVDITLISPRKLGKTGLIYRFFDYLQEVESDYETLYVDIFSSRSLSDFIKLFSEAILKKFPEQTTIGEKFLRVLKGLRPLLSYNYMTGEPQIQINYQTVSEKEYTLHGLFEFLEEQNVPVVLVFDEFQQITEYPEKNIEALLRTYIQPLKNVRFIFCGSKRRIMAEIFLNAKRPFFASTAPVSIDKIDQNIYSNFIRQKFEENGYSVDNEALNFILTWSKGYTFFTQSLSHTVFAMEEKHVSMETVKNACLQILKEYESIFLQYRELLTSAQWNFLIAIAKEEEISQLTSSQFIAKHGIGTPANARRISKSLIDKELILSTPNKKCTKYQIYDVFFSRWLETEY